jgi:hypothetical protein
VDTCHAITPSCSDLVYFTSRFYTAFRLTSTRRLSPRQVFLWETLRVTWTAWVRRRASFNLSPLSPVGGLAFQL